MLSDRCILRNVYDTATIYEVEEVRRVQCTLCLDRLGTKVVCVCVSETETEK